MIKPITSMKNLKEQVLDKKGFTCISLYADWCHPCKAMDPIVESMDDLFDGMIHFYSVDTDKHEEIADYFNYEGVPTFILIKDGKEISRILGYHKKEDFAKKIAYTCEKYNKS